MLSTVTHVALARELHEAERSRTQVRPFSLRHRQMEEADSYAIQAAWMALKRAEGRSAIGRRIGIASRTAQTACCVAEPDHGTLLDDMLAQDGSELEASRFIEPRFELEFAFILSKPLRGPVTSPADVLDATRYVVPALQLIDARIEPVDRETRVPRNALDTIADNAAHGAIVLGRRALKPDAVDWHWTGAVLFKNGMIEESGSGAAGLNHPAASVAWLANKLALEGQSLEPGEIVLGGSFTRPVSCASGDVFHADFGPHGCVSIRLT